MNQLLNFIGVMLSIVEALSLVWGAAVEGVEVKDPDPDPVKA